MNDPRYKTARWRRLRAYILSQSPLCHYCAQAGRITPANTVDHIKPVADGGDFWDEDNLASACESCNYSKRDKAAGDFLVKGCDESGLPVSPRHPWNVGR